MTKMLSSFFVSVWAATALASATHDLDQAVPGNSFGTFAEPSASVRPKFRYWVPDASVDLAEVVNDISLIKSAGLGGIELLGYYLNGNYPSTLLEGGPAQTDWTTYGWGSDAWKALMRAALQATKDHGLLMDYALGPNQGSGVPALPDDEGVLWTLWPFNVSIPLGGSYHAVLPGWGSGQFVSASTALVTKSTPIKLAAAPSWINHDYNGTQYMLAAHSLTDVTEQVSKDGVIHIDFPSEVNGTEYQLFAFYQNHTVGFEQQSPLFLDTCIPQSPVTSFLQNGSRFNDHFSTAGALLIADFWENYMLEYEDMLDLIQEVGNCAWEDSQEFGNSVLVWWTPKLVAAFEAARGFSIREYLPLIYGVNAEANAPLASPNVYITDEADEGQAYVDDYRQTLTELNYIYLETLANWTKRSLRSQYSAQPVYNLPMDMLANIPAVDVPECESLGFNHVIDAYRQFAGPATLSGKRIISSELGAQRNEAYSQTLPELIWDVKRSIVGSINSMIYHGYPFSGHYSNTTWPGFTTFTYRFSNMHGPRQPTWEYYDDFMMWTSRTQFIAQRGVPKIDLAFWLKKNEFFEVGSQYHPNDLVTAGFTYEYLSPDNLATEPEAYVGNEMLAPEQQAFKALIIRGNDTLTVSGVRKVVEYAHAGLSIIFSGGLPSNISGNNANSSGLIQPALAEISDLKNVHHIPSAGLSTAIRELGIEPRSKIEADRIWYTSWREDQEARKTYVFIYNDAWDSPLGGGHSNGSITLRSTGKPYFYDAWSGRITAATAYQQTNLSTTLSLSLAGNQSIIIGFHHGEVASCASYPVSLPFRVSNAAPKSDQQILYRVENQPGPLIFPNGTQLLLPSAPAPFSLTNWTLTVESWEAPVDKYCGKFESVKTNSTYTVTKLLPWKDFSDSLFNVSGRGFYNTTFTWPLSSGDADGALLDLGAIINTARVFLNGNRLTPLDPTHAIADLSEYLVNGQNEIMVVVATTLGNAARLHWDTMRTSGTLATSGPLPLTQDYGLVSEVVVRPYVEFVLGV